MRCKATSLPSLSLSLSLSPPLPLSLSFSLSLSVSLTLSLSLSLSFSCSLNNHVAAICYKMSLSLSLYPSILLSLSLSPLSLSPRRAVQWPALECAHSSLCIFLMCASNLNDTYLCFFLNKKENNTKCDFTTCYIFGNSRTLLVATLLFNLC